VGFAALTGGRCEQEKFSSGGEKLSPASCQIRIRSGIMIF
jgi:hypothetical protein